MWKISVCLFVVLFTAPVLAQTEEALPPNPFAGFETIRLPNGLKVWLKDLPDDPNVFISVTIPFGSYDDPMGKEELAHFTEHMLFSDHLGRTEEQIKREVEDLGGSRNGLTYDDHTFYYVKLDRQYGLFALDWLYRIVSPHEMPPDVVERQRTPMLVELNARPRELLDWIMAYYVYPPWLRLSDFWEREFGVPAPVRDYYAYRSVSRITPEDLRWFYDTYYTPEGMTLTVMGDIDRDAVLEKINATFATLPARAAPQRAIQLRDPRRYRQSIFWTTQANVSYQNGFKLYHLTTDDHQMLLFIQYLLERRLDDKLRYAERKAVYGIWAWIAQHMSATYFAVGGDIKKTEFAYARQVIQDELEALRNGTLSDAEFATDQQAVARNLRIQNIHAESLGWWVTRSFYNPDLHQDFPDLVTFAEHVTKQKVADFARQYFTPEHQLFYLTYPFPVNQAILAVIPAFLVWAVIRLARRMLIVPADMTRIRYVARFKILPIYGLGLLLFFGVAGAVLLRLGVYLYVLLRQVLICPIENFLIQWGIHGMVLMAGAFAGIVLLSRIPYKLLMFDDHLRVKYLFYRSQRILPGDIVTVAPQRFREVWCSRKIWKCVPLTFGLMSPGLYLRLKNGWAYFFRVRQNAQCQGLLEQFMDSNETLESKTISPVTPRDT